MNKVDHNTRRWENSKTQSWGLQYPSNVITFGGHNGSCGSVGVVYYINTRDRLMQFYSAILQTYRSIAEVRTKKSSGPSNLDFCTSAMLTSNQNYGQHR
jgi:hypothetical protein